MAELAGSMERLTKSLIRVLDILIPPDGTKGVVAQFKPFASCTKDELPNHPRDNPIDPYQILYNMV